MKDYVEQQLPVDTGRKLNVSVSYSPLLRTTVSPKLKTIRNQTRIKDVTIRSDSREGVNTVW